MRQRDFEQSQTRKYSSKSSTAHVPMAVSEASCAPMSHRRTPSQQSGNRLHGLYNEISQLRFGF